MSNLDGSAGASAHVNVHVLLPTALSAALLVVGTSNQPLLTADGSAPNVYLASPELCFGRILYFLPGKILRSEN